MLKVSSRVEGQEWRNVRGGWPLEALAEQFHGGCTGEGPRKHGAVKPGCGGKGGSFLTCCGILQVSVFASVKWK